MEQDITDSEEKSSVQDFTQEISSSSTLPQDNSETSSGSTQLLPSIPVLPPINCNHTDTGVQTDITLLSGSHVSSFRPPILAEDISPYPPLPVIATTSAPALLKGQGFPTSDKDSTKSTAQSVEATRSSGTRHNSSHSQEHSDDKSDSKSDLQPTDDETSSSYSAMSELEGVGPPTILQYIKESTRVRRSVPAPKPLSERFPVVDPTIERGNMCPFCHTELLPVPPLSDGSEDEAETPVPTHRSSESPPYNIKDSEKGDGGVRGADTLSRFSVESPPPVIALPEDNEEDKLPLDGYLYCCEDYYWHLVNKCRMERRDSFYQEGEVMEVKKIDVSPHAPFGSKAARKLAKDRASESSPEQPRKEKVVKPRLTPLLQLVRERELERVRPLGGPPRAGGGAATLFSYARQMKTINFALSSRKCLEDGWTVINYKPPPVTPEPVLYDTVDETQSHPRPGLAIPWQQTTEQFNRYYRNGTIFLTLLADGTGTCYYPSGAPAVIIALEQPGIYCYYVLSDSDSAAKLLAVCSQQGRSTVFYPNAAIRYQATPIEGSLFTEREVRSKHWVWDAFQPHVHAPPFQPVYFQISHYFSMRCVSLDQQTLVFNYKRYTFKCSVGSRTKKLHAKPLECTELLQYNKALQDTRLRINDNLRKLNNCISSAHHLTYRDVRLDTGKISPAPRKSADERNRVTLAV